MIKNDPKWPKIDELTQTDPKWLKIDEMTWNDLQGAMYSWHVTTNRSSLCARALGDAVIAYGKCT